MLHSYRLDAIYSVLDHRYTDQFAYKLRRTVNAVDSRCRYSSSHYKHSDLLQPLTETVVIVTDAVA